MKEKKRFLRRPAGGQLIEHRRRGAQRREAEEWGPKAFEYLKGSVDFRDTVRTVTDSPQGFFYVSESPAASRPARYCGVDKQVDPSTPIQPNCAKELTWATIALRERDRRDKHRS